MFVDVIMGILGGIVGLVGAILGLVIGAVGLALGLTLVALVGVFILAPLALVFGLAFWRTLNIGNWNSVPVNLQGGLEELY